jgi:predicted dehydrogenase
VNALRLAAGDEPRVTGAAARLVGPGVDGAMEGSFDFPSGVAGRIRCSLVAERFAAWLRIEGERGWIAVRNPFLPQLGHGLEMELDGVRATRSFELTPTYVFQAVAFRDLVRGAGAGLTTAEDGVANMRAIDAVYVAAGLSRRGGRDQARPSEIDQPPSTGMATPVTNEASSLSR